MNYEITSEVGDNQFFVYETATGHIIKRFNKICDARKLAKHLNNGGGFDGNTPNFFLK